MTTATTSTKPESSSSTDLDAVEKLAKNSKYGTSANSSPFSCEYCADVGIVAYVDGSQGVCQQEGCKGAERVRTEITAMGNLLGAIDNLYQCFLVAPKNRELIARHAKNLFSVYEKYKETVETNSSGQSLKA